MKQKEFEISGTFMKFSALVNLLFFWFTFFLSDSYEFLLFSSLFNIWIYLKTLILGLFAIVVALMLWDRIDELQKFGIIVFVASLFAYIVASSSVWLRGEFVSIYPFSEFAISAISRSYPYLQPEINPMVHLRLFFGLFFSMVRNEFGVKV